MLSNFKDGQKGIVFLTGVLCFIDVCIYVPPVLMFSTQRHEPGAILWNFHMDKHIEIQ